MAGPLTMHQAAQGWEERVRIATSLVQAYQLAGQHAQALSLLSSKDFQRRLRRPDLHFTKLWLEHISLRELGELEKAGRLLAQAIPLLSSLTDVDPHLRAATLLEFGKTYHRLGDQEAAVAAWQDACKIFEAANDEVQLQRARSNIAFVRLHSEDEDTQRNAVDTLEAITRKKAELGDLGGVATNFSTLALHFARRRRFGRALHYSRRDVSLSRRRGHQQELAVALAHLSWIYANLLQFKQARSCLKECIEICDSLGDAVHGAAYRGALAQLAERAKAAAEEGLVVGPRASCGCGSGNSYEECCGRADFDPEDAFNRIGTVQNAALARDGDQQHLSLDFILREDKEVSRRLAWRRIHVRDGWVETFELPDVSNLHLQSAQLLLSGIAQENEIGTTLSVVFLSVAGLEAFINQVVFFVTAPEGIHPARGTIGDAHEYQRKTELTQKWAQMSLELAKVDRLGNPKLWNDFVNLVWIRNELVHFKSTEYEQIIPMPKKPHSALARIPAGIESFDAPHSWPFRVLNRAFAQHAHDTATMMIAEFKRRYAGRTSLALSPDKA